jgi:two-component system chemotaxis response regulator CheB
MKEAEDREEIKTSVVYIVPPNRHMLVADGHISLTSTAFMHFSRPSIDLLFEPVAATYGDKSIGIILSGAGRDGAMGGKAKIPAFLSSGMSGPVSSMIILF